VEETGDVSLAKGKPSPIFSVGGILGNLLPASGGKGPPQARGGVSALPGSCEGSRDDQPTSGDRLSDGIVVEPTIAAARGNAWGLGGYRVGDIAGGVNYCGHGSWRGLAIVGSRGARDLLHGYTEQNKQEENTAAHHGITLPQFDPQGTSPPAIRQRACRRIAQFGA